jgi:hypothetical protein
MDTDLGGVGALPGAGDIRRAGQLRQAVGQQQACREGGRQRIRKMGWAGGEWIRLR